MSDLNDRLSSLSDDARVRPNTVYCNTSARPSNDLDLDPDHDQLAIDKYPQIVTLKLTSSLTPDVPFPRIRPPPAISPPAYPLLAPFVVQLSAALVSGPALSLNDDYKLPPVRCKERHNILGHGLCGGGRVVEGWVEEDDTLDGCLRVLLYVCKLCPAFSALTERFVSDRLLPSDDPPPAKRCTDRYHPLDPADT